MKALIVPYPGADCTVSLHRTVACKKRPGEARPVFSDKGP